MLREYRGGLASVAFGSTFVSGDCTSWLSYVSAGDILHVGEDSAVIGEVNDTHILTLMEPWAGATVTHGRYMIEIRPDNLARVKTEKKRWVELERLIRRYDNVFALEHEWQADSASQDILGKAALNATLGLPLTPVWRDFNNVNMEVTDISQLVAIMGAIGENTQNTFIISWTLKAQIDAATTPEEVEAITWPCDR
jgi:hypothetical protein